MGRLDSNRGLFFKINKRIGEKNRLSPMERVEEILIMLREYIRVGETERKLYGEVFTPIDLVEEMLDGLPKEVWSDPTLKWLDPANGCGIFPAVILKRLMAGLSTWEPDEEQRYKHIMEKMLHVCELQPKNMFIYLCAFDPKDKYALNVYTGSFLTEEFDQHAQEVWGVEKFDVIVGNPPYQIQKEGFKKTQPLWDKFTLKSIAILKHEGFLCTIHPSGWRNVDGVFKKTQNLLKSKQILSLNINNFEQGKKTFGANTNFDYYCLKNINNTEPTKVVTSSSEIEFVQLDSVEFIPDTNINKIYSLVTDDKNNRLTLINNSSYHHQRQFMSKEQREEFIYPCVYMVKTTGEPVLWYSKRNDRGHYGLSKVIFASGVGSGIFIDRDGTYATTEFASSILDENIEVLEKIKTALASDKFLQLIGKTGSDKYNRKIIALFRKDFWKEFV